MSIVCLLEHTDRRGDEGATASTTYSDQAKVKVTGVDRSSRMITLQDARGQTTTVRASDAVRNFDQITVGDTVTVDYQGADRDPGAGR